MQSYSVITLVLSLAIGLICSTNASLEHLYAQENSTSEDLQQSCPSGTGPDPDGRCSPLLDEAIGEEFTPGGSDSIIQSAGEPLIDGIVTVPPPSGSGTTNQSLTGSGTTNQSLTGNVTTREPVGPFDIPGIDVPDIDVPDIKVPDVKKIIEEPAKEITGSLENTLSTINPNIPVSTLVIVGVVVVVAIGAGVASFSRHHHGRSSTSHSSQDQTQQEDTEEEQIYEDVQIVTQGGLEEV